MNKYVDHTGNEPWATALSRVNDLFRDVYALAPGALGRHGQRVVGYLGPEEDEG